MSKHAQSEFVELYLNEKGQHITLSTFSQPFAYRDQSAPFHLDSAPGTLHIGLKVVGQVLYFF